MSAAATQLNLNFFGDTYLPDQYFRGFVVSCRRDGNGKRALGLDCYFGFDAKTELKALGAKWDNNDRCWYFIFNTPDALRLIVGTMQSVLDACLEDSTDQVSLAYQPGIHAESIVVPALRKISRVNSEI